MECKVQLYNWLVYAYAIWDIYQKYKIKLCYGMYFCYGVGIPIKNKSKYVKIEGVKIHYKTVHYRSTF